MGKNKKSKKDDINLEDNFQKLTISKPRKINYWAIEIFDPYELLSIDSVKNWIDEHPAYRINETLHMTLIYLGGKPNNKYTFTEDDKCSIKIDALCFDENCACFRVIESDIKSANEHPHITLALRGNTQAVYSNDLLASKKYVEIPIDCVVNGVVVAH
jgi:tRNA splicing ligase